MNFQDKTYLITGANSGIGKRAALQLAQTDATVVMACRNPERGEKARQDVIRESGNDRVELLIVDMSSQESIRSAVATFETNHNRLDGLVNNAANFDLAVKTP